jgi:hypothetical protein
MPTRRSTAASHRLQQGVINPVVKLAWRLHLPPPGDALLETTWRRTRRPRYTPVCDGLGQANLARRLCVCASRVMDNQPCHGANRPRLRRIRSGRAGVTSARADHLPGLSHHPAATTKLDPTTGRSLRM